MISSKSKILVSVCIATYKREKLLENLLISLADQRADNNIEVEIIVTDNDPGRSANPIVEKIKTKYSIALKYFVQPQKNISLTRNICVANSEGAYICFIDDDETADENWINNLLTCLVKHNADGAFGYVQPVFDPRIQERFRHSEFYFSPVDEDGTEAKYFYTTNCIIRRELIQSEKTPFDPDYGLTGGEDVHLFERLFHRGAKFVSCPKAITFEYIPLERASYRYLFDRALRGGQSFARRKLEQNNNFIYKITLFSKAIILIVFYGTMYVLQSYSGYHKIKYLQILGSSIGKLRSLFGTYKNLY